MRPQRWKAAPWWNVDDAGDEDGDDDDAVGDDAGD
jgi:hypothetical protein